MEKEYLTVKEFARARSCSTQYVYRLLQTKLQPYVVEVDGKKLISAKAFEVFEETNATNQETNFATNFATNVERPSSSTIEEELKRINARNESIIDNLQEQIKAKDAELSKLNDKIISLFETNQRLMENNQQLQLHYQMLLGEPKEKQYVDADEVNANDEEGPKEKPEKEPEEKPKKKGFLNWLFNN